MMQKFLRLFCLVSLMTLSACVITEKFEKATADSEFNTVVVKANASMHEGEWAKAASFYEKAAQMKPEQLDWRVKQAQAYRNGGNLAQAFNIYQLIVDSNAPSNAANDSAVKLAKTQLEKSGFKLEPLSKLIETKPVQPKEPAEALDKAKSTEAPPPPAKIVAVDADVAPAPVVDAKKVETLDASKAVFDEFNAWRAAWQNKNMKAYFSHYVEGFSGEAKNAKAWREQRTAKIKSAKNIQVTFSDAQVNFPSNDAAELKFKQHYRSGHYKDIGQKTLQFKKVDNRWLIAQEVFK
jgi:tetratricopeptide (TPR) repeat protein